MGTEIGEPLFGDGQKLELPGESDSRRVSDQLAFVGKFVRERYRVQLTGTDGDLAIIQRVLDDGVFHKTQTYELQSLGLAFGEAIRGKLGLDWVVVEDVYGRDPALQFRQSAITVFPLTMISKRVEDGKKVDLENLALGIQDLIDEHKDNVAPSQVGHDTIWKKLRRKLPFR
jgi:hypothetical protein